MQFVVNLKAGVRARQQTAGRMFVLESPGTAGQLSVFLMDGSSPIEEVPSAKRGFQARILSGLKFSHIELLAAVDTVAVVHISDNDVALDFISGAAVAATIVNEPLNVIPDRGAPANPVYVSGLTYSDAPATAVANTAAVAVTDVSTALMAANVARKAVRFCNLGPDPVAVGGSAALTWAKRCIVLEVGDTWVEERGANVAWAAICDTGKTASVTAQEVLS